MPGLLEPMKQHDRHHITNMQSLCRRIEADIAGDCFLGQKIVEARLVGNLVYKSPLGEGA